MPMNARPQYMNRSGGSSTEHTLHEATGRGGTDSLNAASLPSDVSRFIGAALGAGDIGLVIDSDSRRKRLEKQLIARGFNVSLAVQQGRFISMDAADLLAKLRRNGAIDRTRFLDIVGSLISWSTNRAKDASAPIAIYDGMIGALHAAGDASSADQLETLWCHIARQHPLRVRAAVLSEPGSMLRENDRAYLREIAGEVDSDAPACSQVDFNEYGRIKQELQDKDQKLVRAEAARDEFLTVAAHELKTPISVLLGFAQLLLRDSQRKREIPPDRLESSIAAVELQCRKLKFLISRLFETIQIGASRIQLTLERTDLVEVVRAAVAAPRGDTTHTIYYDGPESLMALIDPIRLEHAIINLIDNSIEFSPAGGSIQV